MKIHNNNMQNRGAILWLYFAVFLIGIVSANIPQTMNVQGKLTNSSSGIELTGIYQINFTIYDNASGGNILWNRNYSVITDSNGVYSIILTNLGMNFSDAYYLGIAI